ncbi:MAG TPA: HNH endonuclease, partial [Blastocatellia bacterium]|nr:HNH endonuclease [Blastocatellia bacterium]
MNPTARNRDDFGREVRDLLAKRVGMKCSNPNCRQLTSGPQEDPKKALNIGVAAHIAAAAPGGPRYDPQMTQEERKSESNGIW